MIDRASIMAWNEQAPWTEPAMVEQDFSALSARIRKFETSGGFNNVYPRAVSRLFWDFTVQ